VVAGGELEPTQVLDHLCRCRPCVRPEHLEAVSQRVNLARRDPEVWVAAVAAAGLAPALPPHQLALAVPTPQDLGRWAR
jgi:hypothetical protein